MVSGEPDIRISAAGEDGELRLTVARRDRRRCVVHALQHGQPTVRAARHREDRGEVINHYGDEVQRFFKLETEK